MLVFLWWFRKRILSFFLFSIYVRQVRLNLKIFVVSVGSSGCFFESKFMMFLFGCFFKFK